jgi:hypothetical protein
MRKRFDLAMKARKEADRVQPDRRGVWIPLYRREDESENVSYVGGGAGLDYPPIAKVKMNGGGSSSLPSLAVAAHLATQHAGMPLSIAEAKHRLSLALGVSESSIKITVEA